MRNIYKNFAWAVVTLLLVSLLFSMFTAPAEAPKSFTLSELASQISKDEVKEIKVSGEQIEITLKDDSKAVAQKEDGVSVTETLTNLGVAPEKLREVQLQVVSESGWQFWAGLLIPTVLPILVIGFIFWFMFRQARTGVNQAFTFGRSGIRLSGGPGKEKRTFADVAGLKEAKEELIEIVDFLKNPKKFLDLGAKIPRGVLLVGPPGTGKTLLAQATAGQSGVPFFHISASEFVEMFVGVGASVSGDTPVLIKDRNGVRLVPIAEFADEQYRPGEEGLRRVRAVETLGYAPMRNKFWGTKSNEKTFFGGSAWSNVQAVYRHKVSKIYKIKYRGGVIKTTGDHSIFVRNRNMITAKKASEITPGDILVNLPFKTRGVFIPGVGTTHNVRAHKFSEAVPAAIDLYGAAHAEEMRRYDFALTNRNVMSQAAIGATIGASQSGVKDWQLGRRFPRLWNTSLYRAGAPFQVAVTPDLLRLLGYYTAEGNTDRYGTHFTFGIHEKDLHADCSRLIRNTFRLEPYILPRPETNSLRINVSSKAVSEFFESQCGTGAQRKHVPQILWDLQKEYFLEYLRGYTRGDGYTTQDGKLSATSVSKQLIIELAWLAAMHGIQVGVRETIAPAGRVIKGGTKALPETRSWNLIIGKTAHPFAEAASIPNQFKKPIVERIEEEVYDGYVYDLCGCDNEAFFGGEKPVLLHNSRTRDAFQTAKKAAPAILFIDEIDAVGRQRGAGLGGGNDEREQTLNQILVEMDGFERDTQLIVLAATNRPDVLDPALLRPGRFDRHVILDAPDINDREEILKIHSRNKPLAPDVELRKIAVRTPGFVGADLENVLNEGALLAARKNKKVVEQIDLYEAIEKVILGPERRNRAITKHERELTAYHEGGHALVAATLKDADPVHKISIVSRGLAGGYTMKLPTEERRLRTKTQFITDLAVALGGFAAEKMIFGDVSTGASNDLKTASSIARQLVTKYGMSSLGPVTFGKTEELLFLGREISTEKNYSEDTAKKIDKEVHGFIESAHDLARNILTKHRKALKALADKLMEKETLEQEEFNQVLKPFKIKPLGI